MSNIKDTIMKEFDGVEENEAYYDPTLDHAGHIPEYTYPAHISGLIIKENITVKKTGLADIYEVFVTIADAVKEMDIPIDPKDKTKGEISGAIFAGKEYKSSGIFRYKTPPQHMKKQGYEAKPGSNKNIKYFCENIGLPLDIAKEREDGKHLLKIPRITLEKIQGKPVLVNIYKRFWTDRDGTPILSNKDKSPMFSMEVRSTGFLPWPAGKPKKFNVIEDIIEDNKSEYGEDIPF